MTKDGVTWTYTYDANGMRTKRTDGTNTYEYVYNGDKLMQMTRNGEVIRFSYAGDIPITMTYDGDTFYYITNTQGDVTGITDGTGKLLIGYLYNGWRATSYTLADTEWAPILVNVNPLMYRGYVYDRETKLFYLQSRYYDPELGRFINADAFVSTGQGVLGNNMFAYCNNNPVLFKDSSGCYPLQASVEFLETWIFGDEDEMNYSEGSSIVRALKKSSKMQSYIDAAIEEFKKGNTPEPGTGEFTANEDGWDLYLSTQHFDYTITVEEKTRTVGILWWKHEEVQYTATVVVHDKYNFDSFREWNGFGNVMNNLAYGFHILGGGNDFDWYATYTYSTKWTDIS